jgi:uncharacterized protein with HEPN domain
MSRGDPLRVRDYLEHISQAIANIREYTAGMNATAYLADRKTQDAVMVISRLTRASYGGP